ncbi:E3 ubiquitin-protein ligase DCST1 [Patella vulgata]|uniref:E3 ubiquitin-protein ligase DCST1 n=1 Tax=Patella vulgata TaxID=6465 RepID=UPI0024A9428F|nr:E3 ubiquitin-protein ligase DCST1 [Patella vulgata]
MDMKLIRSDPDEYTTMKSMICFPIGCVIALVFYYSVIVPIRLQEDTKRVVGALLGISLAVGFGISTQVRCIITLVIPIFFGKSGRSYVAAFAVVYLIGGPVANLMNNAQEVTGSLSCITELLANHTASKWELRLKPLGDSLKELQDYRCEDVFSQGVIRCRKWFGSAFDKCMKALWVLGYAVCWPMKLDFFCELVRFVPGAAGLDCNSMAVMNPGLGEVFLAAKKMTNGLESKLAVNLQFKMVKSPGDLDYTTAEETRKSTMHEFETRKVVVDFFMTLLQRLLAFTFVLVFISAYKYHKNYLSDFRYDNNYITAYFRRIDARRHGTDKKVLLPLKRLERNDVIFPSTPKLQKRENRKLVKGTVKLLFRVIISGIVVLLDHLLYTVLSVIGTHSHVDYRQRGEHHIDLKVYGNGFMGDIVKLFLEAFNQKHEIDNITTNLGCLPRPSKVDSVKVYMMFGIYAAVWCLLYLQAYGLRMRRVISGFYYRKREKRRTLYLYNDMLKKRNGFLRHMRHKVRKQVKARELKVKTSLVVSLRREFPIICCFLILFGSSKDTCLICEDTEGRGFYKCTTSGCNFGYCQESATL